MMALSLKAHTQHTATHKVPSNFTGLQFFSKTWYDFNWMFRLKAHLASAATDQPGWPSTCSILLSQMWQLCLLILAGSWGLSSHHNFAGNLRPSPYQYIPITSWSGSCRIMSCKLIYHRHFICVYKCVCVCVCIYIHTYTGGKSFSGVKMVIYLFVLESLIWVLWLVSFLNLIRSTLWCCLFDGKAQLLNKLQCVPRGVSGWYFRNYKYF